MTRRVLLIDDDPALRELIEALLEAAGYECLTAADGEAGLAAIRDRSPDAVLLDLNLPGLDGFAILQALRDDPPAHPPPILVLTARFSHDDAERVLALGAADFLAKPFGNMDLLARLRRLPRP